MDRDEYLQRYKARMIERGVDEAGAQAATDAEAGNLEDGVTFVDDMEPEDAADEEISCWDDDGDDDQDPGEPDDLDADTVDGDELEDGDYEP